MHFFFVSESEHIEFDEFCQFMEQKMNETQNSKPQDASDELKCAFEVRYLKNAPKILLNINNKILLKL